MAVRIYTTNNRYHVARENWSSAGAVMKAIQEGRPILVGIRHPGREVVFNPANVLRTEEH